MFSGKILNDCYHYFPNTKHNNVYFTSTNRCLSADCVNTLACHCHITHMLDPIRIVDIFQSFSYGCTNFRFIFVRLSFFPRLYLQKVILIHEKHKNHISHNKSKHRGLNTVFLRINRIRSKSEANPRDGYCNKRASFSRYCCYFRYIFQYRRTRI